MTGFAAVFLLLFLGLAARLFHLQLVRGDFYRSISTSNHIRVIYRPAPRGIIRDRNGEILVDNVPSFVISAVRSEFDTTATEEVASLIGIPADSLRARLGRASSRPFRPFVVVDDLDLIAIGPLSENLHRFGGLIIDVVPRRRYYHGMSFCHIVGYVGESEEDGAFEGEITGRAGLESTLNYLLAGQPGYTQQVVDAMGRVVSEFEGAGEVAPMPGHDLTLTIDTGLQELTCAILDEETAPGAAVILDYKTGEILCLASSPGFDPQTMADGISVAGWREISQNPERPMFSRAWAARYPPGSVYKLISAAYLLQYGFITPDFRPDPCYGSYHLGGNDFGCWSVHGRLDVVDALARSCDVFFYRTIQLGSMDGLAEFSRKFGLGRRLLNILPGESRGLVPDRLLMDSLYGSGGWGLGNLLNLSIGQGELLVNPLQMAVMTGIFASGGEMPGLKLVREIPAAEAPWSDLELSVSAVSTVVEGMREAVYGNAGTLSSLSSMPWEFFGKSGTAESSAGDHAWVVGFIREPEPLAIAVVVEHGGHGGAVAAPIVYRILAGYLGDGG